MLQVVYGFWTNFYLNFEPEKFDIYLEINRLERNQEREQHLANMEYVKNIIVKVCIWKYF